jgi:hypothetical protein
MIGVAFALKKLYPVRHELLRNVIYPQELVPERNDYYRIKNIWTPEQAEKLLEVVKAQGSYETAARDQTSVAEEIGEATPINPDGSCPHHFLVPNKNNTKCVLP